MSFIVFPRNPRKKNSIFPKLLGIPAFPRNPRKKISFSQNFWGSPKVFQNLWGSPPWYRIQHPISGWARIKHYPHYQGGPALPASRIMLWDPWIINRLEIADWGLSQNVGKLVFGRWPWVSMLHLWKETRKQYSLLDTTLNDFVELGNPGICICR